MPVLFEVALVGILSSLVSKVEHARERAAHERELGSHLNSIILHHFRSFSLGMVRRMDSGGVISAAEEKTKSEIHAEVERVRALVARDPKEHATWNNIVDDFNNLDEIFARARRYYASGDKVAAGLAWVQMQSGFDSAIEMSKSLADEQTRRQDQYQVEYETYDQQLKNVLNLSVLASALLAFSLTVYFNASTARRLDVIMDNTQLLAMGKPPQAKLSGTDELARIDAIYHRMYTALEALRRKERAILDNASEVICSIDDSLSFVNVNSAASRLWGYSTDDLIARRVLDLVEPEDKSLALKKMQEATSEKNEVRFEAKVHRADGALADTAWSVTWSDDDRSLYCVISDISERKKLEQLKQDFVAMISHDLRTPLTSVLASLELVSSPHNDNIDNESRDHLFKAEKNLKLSLTLINQLLEIEKMESGVIALNFDATSTKEVVRKAVDSVADLAQAKNLEIQQPQSNIDFVGDADKLVQVMINLLGNAIKFSPDGGKIVLAEEQGAELIRFTVTDQGPGISTEDQERIFERFQQGHTGTMETGTGLGLAICKAIVEAHGGKIGIESKIGSGSTFWFELPLEQS